MAAVVREAQKTVHSPPSAFANLLRRSRFSSFDPEIRQTYFAPPEYAHRGNWGLKRPLPMRHRDSFITVNSVDEHSLYTDWDNAEDEVRFIRSIQEMNTFPTVNLATPWAHGLGQAKTDWLIDTDYANAESDGAQETMTLEHLGQRGKGQYGRHRPESSSSPMLPNIHAMLPKDFKRYIRKLRKQRFAFKEFVAKQEGAQRQTKQKNNKEEEEGSLLFHEVQKRFLRHHGHFLGEQARQEYSDRRKRIIEPQPHGNGGLMYTRQTVAETKLHTRAQPGLVLHRDVDAGNSFTPSQDPDTHVVSFGSLAAKLTRDHRGAVFALSLFNMSSMSLVNKGSIDDSIFPMTLVPKGGLELLKPPVVVGRSKRGLKSVHLKALVQIASDEESRGQSNPYAPGTVDYITADPMPGRGGVQPLHKNPSQYPGQVRRDRGVGRRETGYGVVHTLTQFKRKPS